MTYEPVLVDSLEARIDHTLRGGEVAEGRFGIAPTRRIKKCRVRGAGTHSDDAHARFRDFLPIGLR